MTLGDVTGVDLTPTGLTVTPTYLGVTVTPPAGSPSQATGNPATAGSFPQSFVDFQGLVGTASYWYSSGGGADIRKPTTPLTVSWSEPGAASVSVSDTTLLPNGAQQVTVEGTGFDPALATGVRPPLAGRPSGAYIAFGRYADVWKQSAGAPSSARVNAGGAGLRWAVPAADMETIGGAAAGAVELRPDGTFSATLTVDKAVVDAKTGVGNYGIYTYPGSGAVQAAYETYTPITFAKASPTVAVTAGNATYGADVPVSVSVTGRRLHPERCRHADRRSHHRRHRHARRRQGLLHPQQAGGRRARARRSRTPVTPTPRREGPPAPSRSPRSSRASA